MIRIEKTAEQAPSVLRIKGKSRRRVNSSLYTRFSNDYDNGTRKFKLDSAIYAHKTVKDKLQLIQHNKCCFCESRIDHISFGDVEHFRPKAGYRQKASDSLARPGYYWLAYEWNNLLLSCQLCNQRFKRNLFPLSENSQRAKTHKDDLRAESPLFINPTTSNPEQHISFRAEIPYSIDGNSQAQTTISSLGLDREALNEQRRDRLAKLKVLFDLVQLAKTQSDNQALQALAVEARQELNQAIIPSAEYSAMARAAINSEFQWYGLI